DEVQKELAKKRRSWNAVRLTANASFLLPSPQQQPSALRVTTAWGFKHAAHAYALRCASHSGAGQQPTWCVGFVHLRPRLIQQPADAALVLSASRSTCQRAGGGAG